MHELNPEEARVVGSLAEKQLTTPQYYPLTLNALVNACNQSNNREPVVSYSPATVEQTLSALRAKGLARVLHAGGGNRTAKYRHVLDEVLGLDRRELALVTVLMLRGPQTLAELRTRTQRMADFDDAGAVERDLARLAEREEPLVVLLDRQPGHKEPRYATTLVAVSPPPHSGDVRAP
ncbi:MAG: YceH family protein [Actinobacteria bacterium]|nr:YceH family protein [Actinomycetota bacterium]